MVAIPLGLADYRRGVAQEPEIRLVNRYFETNPANQQDQVALLARMGLKRLLAVGEGPIRAVYSQPGAFDGALFVVSGSALYRIDPDGTLTFIGAGIWGNGLGATVSLAATDNYLFVADGRALWIYIEDAFAAGTLTATGAIASGDQFEIGGTHYRWTSGSVDAGAPAGTVGNPWLVALGGGTGQSLENAYDAVNGSGIPSDTYSTALTSNAVAQAMTVTATVLRVQAREAGTGGNAITTTETGANIAWGAGTLTGGGGDSFGQVAVPDDVGIISVGYIAGFVICVVAQGYGFNGRFYWIEPDATTIDPLNFATAERAPDPVWNVSVVGDQFWLPGSGTTEVWYPTGAETIPFLRVQGRVFDRGIWEGTAAVVKDTLVLVDTDGVVYAISDGPRRISDSGIEERVRRAQVAATINPGG